MNHPARLQPMHVLKCVFSQSGLLLRPPLEGKAHLKPAVQPRYPAERQGSAARWAAAQQQRPLAARIAKCQPHNGENVTSCSTTGTGGSPSQGTMARVQTDDLSPSCRVAKRLPEMSVDS